MLATTAEPGDDFTHALAEALHAAKEYRHHTVRSLAAATGISQSSVQRYLDGRRPIPIPALRILAKELGTTAGALMDRAEDQL